MAASQVVPPGYDPPADAKSKTKSAKRNERKKEKRLQDALEKGKKSEALADDQIEREDVPKEDLDDGSESVKSLTSQMTDLAFSPNHVSTSPPSNSVEASDVGQPALDLDKKIRALKKKLHSLKRLQIRFRFLCNDIRLAEAQQKTPQQDMKPEQLEKLA
ncbi:Detected protein of confused Function [Hibiscus syriacus]|uniref:Detected protein of confused Function n=1 Tax=Hibiscus syriacus TaxID=106335 RepID=A0A6A2ZFD5_HIBSY|nr:Detected protein of confused Function [Hibiscus syriacus]